MKGEEKSHLHNVGGQLEGTGGNESTDMVVYIVRSRGPITDLGNTTLKGIQGRKIIIITFNTERET